MTPGERWLATLWPLIRGHLPAPPAGVVDVGCGPLGGFVPFLRSSGYEATGVDPEAPDTADYHRTEFEHLELRERVDAVIASTSLHHVTDPAEVIDQFTTALTSEGTLVVVEWAWEKFDETTARWCFQRLGRDDEANWLHRLRDEWTSSEQGWQAYLANWATREGLHRGEALLRLLDERFERRLLTCGPYFFSDLSDTTVADEEAAIEAEQIRATRIDWVGTPR
jgi:SAM-dependent methyltransferase